MEEKDAESSGELSVTESDDSGGGGAHWAGKIKSVLCFGVSVFWLPVCFCKGRSRTKINQRWGAFGLVQPQDHIFNENESH